MNAPAAVFLVALGGGMAYMVFHVLGVTLLRTVRKKTGVCPVCSRDVCPQCGHGPSGAADEPHA